MYSYHTNINWTDIQYIQNTYIICTSIQYIYNKYIYTIHIEYIYNKYIYTIHIEYIYNMYIFTIHITHRIVITFVSSAMSDSQSYHDQKRIKCQIFLEIKFFNCMDSLLNGFELW